MTEQNGTDITAAEMMEIFRGREWARLVVGQIDTLKLNSFYACHAVLSEVFAKMLNIDIEASRAVVDAFMKGLIESGKQVQAKMTALAADQGTELPNVITFVRKDAANDATQYD